MPDHVPVTRNSALAAAVTLTNFGMLAGLYGRMATDRFGWPTLGSITRGAGLVVMAMGVAWTIGCLGRIGLAWSRREAMPTSRQEQVFAGALAATFGLIWTAAVLSLSDHQFAAITVVAIASLTGSMAPLLAVIGSRR